MNIALITGASSGLGREFARQVSRDPHVQAVWAVAGGRTGCASWRPCAPARCARSPWT